jgi:hypothetical protein
MDFLEISGQVRQNEGAGDCACRDNNPSAYGLAHRCQLVRQFLQVIQYRQGSGIEKLGFRGRNN